MPLFPLSEWTLVWMWWCPGWGCCRRSLSNPDPAENTRCYTAKRTWKRPSSTTWRRAPLQSASSQIRRFFKGSHGRLQNIPALRYEIKPFMTVGVFFVVCTTLFSLRSSNRFDCSDSGCSVLKSSLSIQTSTQHWFCICPIISSLILACAVNGSGPWDPSV